MRRREVLILGASLVGAAAARRALGQDPVPSPRAAVVIGVDRPGDLTPLNGAVSGARMFGDWLVSEGFEVRRFIDDNGPVEMEPIKDTVKELVKRSNLTQLVIYFAGHGCLITGSERWLLSGAPEDSGAAVNFAASFDRAQLWPVPNMVFISDACRSRPESLRMDFLSGESIFPTPDGAVGEVAPKIDKFFAARPGQAALEVPMGENVTQYEGIYTSVFLEAFKSPDETMVLDLGAGVKVVPNRRLEDFLFREVRKRSAQRNINLRQWPQTDVCSSDSTYIGRLTAASRTEEARAPEPNLSDVVSLALAQVDPSLSAPRPEFSRASVDAIAAESGFTEARSAILAAPDQPPSGVFLTSGFTIVGAAVESIAVSAGARTERAVNGEQTIVHVEFEGPAATVAIRFENGAGTVVAGLRDFVGHIVVEGGLVRNVSYDEGGNPPSDRIRELRATVAAAAELGIFRIQGYGEQRTRQALELGNALRMGKFADPTLGLYAAYAYNEAALIDMVNSVAGLMRGDLNAILFDVAMLNGELSGREPPDDVFPLCPMLLQGWNLVRVRDVQLPETYLAAQPHLLPALWTTFGAPGMNLIMQALEEGRLR
ncbi:caspase family protein (plasmid) [Sinorhizobium medicae]|uniref:caspase family protein n=1 Tax=Sinorhizobium medicae TaxID=110321 RepID=UPI001F1BBC3B|nr:caspase family protein [Sinorhizobium medicae]